jgi:predicted nucleic acid-binding protein
MKAFLDTSVLVRYGDHIHHDASLSVFTRFRKQEVGCGAHTLIEVYATLTRMPGKYRINPDQAMLFVENIWDRLTVITLTPDEYHEMVRLFSGRGIAGAMVYDALLAACALKGNAKRLFTWNLRHYSHFGPDVSHLLQTP